MNIAENAVLISTKMTTFERFIDGCFLFMKIIHLESGGGARRIMGLIHSADVYATEKNKQLSSVGYVMHYEKDWWSGMTVILRNFV